MQMLWSYLDGRKVKKWKNIFHKKKSAFRTAIYNCQKNESKRKDAAAGVLQLNQINQKAREICGPFLF